ncbi:alkylation response protein AidB-like acyl-CoA dehydrogenase [Kibdelosporangium banguiense]|uniref:Alkylation response protein AidB-like acyl-CoA dehydrogenase n=1 Tax=Kibdelosporangium banguiense TaxID=1365924 RepID=A0ABS4TVW1_9PSEU|nr:acyl-CoA dehydrogenase family protein [Kibdelosporangium banguiense]MBP2328532.1 alkylation response protein AidB-like acyl-CoA dehydrogenase [Kibdelosporangium banguiense]
MDFSLAAEQTALRQRVISFATDQLGAKAAEHDRDETFDADGWQACAEFGVLGWPVPREYGGSGYDPLTTIIACEALGYGCVDNGLVFAIENHLWACVIYLLRHGSPEQKARLLPHLTDGSMIGAHALTEPDTGSDVLALRTTARREGEMFLLSGTKCFISNAPCADLFVVFARTADDGPAQRALSAFLVPRETPGLTIRRTISKAGLRATPMGEVGFDDCPVPAANLLGGVGAGYQIFTSTIEWERGFMAASQVGRLGRLLDTSVGYASERRQFDRPIGAFQAVSHRLADMRVRLELARLMLHKFGWLKQQGRMALLESAMLKLFVSESLLESALSAVRVHGARGYVADLPVERELRDAMGCAVYGGTSDIQRNVVAGLTGVVGAS